MKTELFWQVTLRLGEDADEVIRQAYLYAEQPKNRRTLEEVVHDLLYHDDFHDEVVENYVLDILANRAYPLKPKLIELRKDK
jgi:hypothetical protein